MKELESKNVLNRSRINKKGTQITDNLTYGSLFDINLKGGLVSFSDFITKSWSCPDCMMEFYSNRDSMIEHIKLCKFSICFCSFL